MRDVKRNLLLLLSMGVLAGFSAGAQDDLDFDALIDELSTNQAPAEPLAEAEAAPEEPAAEVAEDPLAAFEEAPVEAPPAATEDPLAAFEEAPAEVADDPLAAFEEAPVEVAEDPLAAFEEAPAEAAEDPLAAFEEAPVEVAEDPLAAFEEAPAEVADDPLAAFEEAPAEVADDPLAAFEEAPVEVAEDPLAAFEEAPVEVAEDPLAAFEEAPAEVAEDPLAAFEEAPAEVAEDPLAAFEEAPAEVAEDPLAAFEEAPAEVADDPLAAFDEAPAEPAAEAAEDFDMDDLFGEEEPAEEMAPAEEVMEEAVEEDFFEEEAPALENAEAVEEPAEAPATPQLAAKTLSTAEEVKRQAREVEGLQSLQEGFALLNTEQYAEALEAFSRAKSNLPIRPATEEAKQKATWGQIEANYRLAKQALDLKNISDAERFASAILELDPTHRGAGRIMAKANKIKKAPLPDIQVKKTQEYLDKMANLEEIFNKGRQYFDAKDYDTAQVYFERVLILDPYHINSMRFLRKISERRFAVYSKELKSTQADMIQQVRDTWNPPIEGGVEIPEDVRNQETQTTVSDAAILEEKMQDIIIPAIEFRSANIQDVVAFMVEASIVGDPTGEGVNIILNLNIPGQSSGGGGGGGFSAPAEDPFASADPFADPFADMPDDGGFDQPDGGGSPGMGSDIPSITMNLRRVKLLDAIRYITEVANLKYRVESTAVIITPSDVPSGRVITRVYPVLPSFLEVVVDRPELDQADRQGEFVALGARNTEIGTRGQGVKEFFIQAGIPFPQGTSISYNPSISSLIVANTQENIELFERLLPQFNVVPNQVEIEARFVEVSQTDIEQFGFEWAFTDNYEIATEKGPGPVATKERLQLDADLEGASKGVRFLNLGSAGIEATSKGAAVAGLNPLGDILSFSSILTNPEMNLIIHALDQNGNADVLSAPRITTRSGVNAQIEVVEEIIYPTEFETNISTLSAQGAGGTSSDQQFVTITPGSFETRETGVILNVTPTVGPDGYTIELVLAPEVAELVDWLDYGGSQGGVSYRIPQPIFASRNVATSIVIWDGQTVVMGGLITERLLTINDKIPILGDIPLIGRFFQNKGESSDKRNLLIFVTARVVDPAGKPIRRADPTVGQPDQSS